MLLAIRERIMGFLGWVILGLIFIAFAFWGIDSYLQSSAITYAASVNDVEISRRQYDTAYQTLVRRMREALGSNYEKAGYDEETLRSRALQGLIRDELFIQAAESAGFAAGDSMIAAEINSVEAFRVDGQFSKEQYQRMLGYQGMSPGLFEWQLRRELIANQLKTGIAMTSIATDDYFSRIFRLQGQKRRFDHVLLPAELVADQVTVSDADLEDYYNRNGETFMSPERAKVQYVELRASALELDSSFEEEQIEALYEEQSGRFVTPEERHARHILISIQDSSDEVISTARSKAEDVIQRLEAGEDFAALAKEISEDPGSSANGGDLGFFGRGVMTQKFEEAVFSMNAGDRSQPVQSSFGFHIIELLEVRPEQRTPLEDVRDQLIGQLQQEERADIFYEKSDLLANIAFEQPDTLEGAAEQVNLEIRESDWIGRDGGEGIGAHENVVTAVFGEDVLLNGNNSAPIEIGEDHIVVLRILDHQEAELRPLDEVREQVAAASREEKTRTLLEEKGRQLLADLEAGESTLEDVAAAHELTAVQNPPVTRVAASPERAIIDQAFLLPPPVDDRPVYSGFVAAGGGYALVALHEVEDGSVDDLKGEQRKLVQRNFNRIIGTSEVQMLQGELERKASVHIPEADNQ